MSRAFRRAETADAAAEQRRRWRAVGPALIRWRKRSVRAALNPYRNLHKSIFTDKKVGATVERDGDDALLKYARRGDTLVV